MLYLEKILNKEEIAQLKSTRNIKSSDSFVNWIAQTMNWIPWTYEYAVKLEAEDSVQDIENPLKTILIISWLCHAIGEGKLGYKGKPIRLKMDDYLVRHLWDFSLRTEHYSMCVESLYLFYQGTNNLNTKFLSPDQLRVYATLRSDNPLLSGKQRSYLKVRDKIVRI